MDSDIEDLESLLSEHFGITPLTTPCGSQEDEGAVGLDAAYAADDPDPEEPDINIDDRVREYLAAQVENQDDDESGDEEGDFRHQKLPQDDEYVLSIAESRKNGCCKNNCFTNFDDHELFNHILHTNEMEKGDRELYIMTTVADTFEKDITKRGKKRKKVRHNFSVLGRKVCRKVFMLAFNIRRTCLENILSHVDEHGVTKRVHGNTGKRPSKSLQFEDIKYVVSFISRSAEEIGLPQPAAPRGTDGMAPIFLPSTTTKLEIHSNYEVSCRETAPAKRAVHYTTFLNIWGNLLQHIKIATPREDVCAKCEKMRKQVMDSITEEDKLENTQQLRDHVLDAQRERDTYNNCVRQAKENNGGPGAYVHYTFDYSQNVSLPHHARQMGPTYFMSLRKVQLFGVRNDGIPRQYNFVVDENETIGEDGTQSHGPNSVISMLDWVIEHDHIGETSINIHADNCPGQNKNQFMLGYLMWRVMSGRHMEITYMMQVPGHARCHVDAGFAAVKRLYRRTDTDTLDQLEETVNRSSATNTCVRYPAWVWRDWKSFLGPCFKALIGIRKFQYFRISGDQPGIVAVKERSDGEEHTVDIRKSRDLTFDRHQLPNRLEPAGMSAGRIKYLYNTVRPYVRPNAQDVTCPRVGP